jgi:hypothetical protein
VGSPYLTGDTQIHCVGRMQGFGILKKKVHIKTTGFNGLREKFSVINLS